MRFLTISILLASALLHAISIFDIQFTTDSGDGTYPSNYEGQTVTTGGIVTGTDFSNGRFFIESSAGGPWNGIYIYNNDYEPAIGDSVVVTGQVYEYYGFTELSPVYALEIVSSGNPLPDYTAVSSWEVSNEEAYESVLVELSDVTVSYEFDEWGYWYVDGGSGTCLISNGFFDFVAEGIPIIQNYLFSHIRGIVSYSWQEYQLHPRFLDDLQSAENGYIISIAQEHIISSETFAIPVELTYFGQVQQVENYFFSLEYNNDILMFSHYDVENTLSENGEISLDDSVAGVIELSFSGNFSFSGKQDLLKLNFSGISCGDAGLEFSEFFLNETEIVYYSLGQIFIQTEEVPIGDTLTVIQKPLLNIPEIVTPGAEFTIQCLADETTTGWFAELNFSDLSLELPISSSYYNNELQRWFHNVTAPEPQLFELYDLTVGASNLEPDTTENAVRIIPQYREEYSFVHITDSHLPTHIYYPDPESLTDTSEMEDLLEVIADINLINPEFVLITGDLVNEGEMEDFENRRVYTKAQQLLTEFEVPIYLVAGNHDLGGWQASPPPQGTARRNWWRFFGWSWLQNPPAAEPYYTQNYSFNYGNAFFMGMEAYLNYDEYMYDIYGYESFTAGQMQWLQNQIANSADSDLRILFYHMDFSDQIELEEMGIDLALYGHIHSNSGSIFNPPFNLATESTCDGERAYRIIKVENDIIYPQQTISAGWYGENLEIEFFPDNEGTADSVTAIINNQHPQTFYNARIKFLLPAGEFEYEVINGEIEQINSFLDPQVIYVRTDIPANDELMVTIRAEAINSTENQDMPNISLQLANYPNPFNPSTTISVHLPAGYSQLYTDQFDNSKDLKLIIYNLKGQKVKVFNLIQKGISETIEVIWDGTDESGNPVSSGVYLCRMKTDKQELTRKMVLLR